VDSGNSSYGTSIVGTVSGTAISFGSPVVAYSLNTAAPTSAYDINAGQVVVCFHDVSATNSQAVSGTVSGTSISFGSPVVLVSASAYPIAATYDEDSQQIIVSYKNLSNNYGYSLIFKDGSTNSADFIGITAEAISDTATGAVNVYGGINEAQTGLTIGSDYYVQADGSLQSPTAPAPYNLSGASYDSVSFSVNSQEPAPNAVVFNPTGTKMFVVGQTNNTVYEYALSTEFDLSTASYTQSFSVSAQSAYSVGLAFNLDGTKMFVADYTNSNVYEYALSTGFNVSTASYTQTLSVSTQSSGPSGLVFNLDGTKMFITAFTGQDVNEYSLSTAFDISTATYAQNFSTASQETQPQETVFSSNGKKMFVVGSNTSTIYEYSLSTGYDISTASYSSISFSVSSQEAQSRGLAFNSSGNKFFMCGGFSGGAVYQYSTGVGSATSVKVGQAISATTINMMDLT
jgi:sugar lactone lactonase YvrE